VSQLLIASLDSEDGECFNKLFVSLHNSELLTADVLIKVSCLLTCSLTLVAVTHRPFTVVKGLFTSGNSQIVCDRHFPG